MGGHEVSVGDLWSNLADLTVGGNLDATANVVVKPRGQRTQLPCSRQVQPIEVGKLAVSAIGDLGYFQEVVISLS